MNIDFNTLARMIKSESSGSITSLNDKINNPDESSLNFGDILSGAMSSDIPIVEQTNVIPAEVAIQSMLRRLDGSGIDIQKITPSTMYTSLPSDYDGIISEAAQKYGVPVDLIKSVIKAESGFNETAVSSAGAKGLMQLMDATARGFGVTDSFDPIQNIDAGTNFLSGLLEKYNGSETMALAAYNAGPGRVDRMGAANETEFLSMLWKLPQETQNYIPKVLGYMGKEV